MKANDNYKKNHEQNKEPICLNDWDLDNLYGWAMSQTLTVISGLKKKHVNLENIL